ncbi:hypothetical protein [Nocardia noduli]|uniref:hypothetical protein n=1 Tax=Nocardia noduli TaxID=2815722 RepID=UPI001C240762|nr:hypothetical protein [Nocardia noduli]
MTAAQRREEPIKGHMVLIPTPPEDGFTARDLPRLLPEGGYAPTGIFRNRVKVDRPFPIDIELPDVTW